MKEVLLGWQWVIRWLAGKVFWEWEFIPLFGFDPYVLAIQLWSWPQRVENKDD